MADYDFIVVGAGIAGASVAAHLAATARVCILEMEDRAGYHTTGRSAAMYEPNYGPPPMQAFTRASRSFLDAPPAGFSDAPLMTPRVSIFFEAEGQEVATARLLAESSGLEEISEHDAQKLFPVLRQGYARRSFLDIHTANMDVDLIHRGYLKMARARGADIHFNASVDLVERRAGQWTTHTPHGRFRAKTLINAAGAWGDIIAAKAGVAPIGLVPKRRSIGIVPVPNQSALDTFAMVTDVGETWYAKPQSGKLLVSSADATPVEPHDAYADDMAIAEGIDRLMAATTLTVERLEHSWGGLRTFAADGSPYWDLIRILRDFSGWWARAAMASSPARHCRKRQPPSRPDCPFPATLWTTASTPDDFTRKVFPRMSTRAEHSVGEALVGLLEAYGVDTIFGIPGVHNIEMYRALPRSKIRHILPRHEQGAGFMADGYARATGKPGCASPSRDPGLPTFSPPWGRPGRIRALSLSFPPPST